jgi:8-oxo-dGTP pyrophosphatase MutT (NUDIX family)
MVREISAGGVVIKRVDNEWMIAVIEPQREAGTKAKQRKVVFALPKGIVDAGETAEQTAIREVSEETGLAASPVTKLMDIKYMYVRTWGDQERVFKIVSFYLLRYESGNIDDIPSEMRIEVKRACWLPLREAERKLAYRGEKDVVRRAQAYLTLHSEV